MRPLPGGARARRRRLRRPLARGPTPRPDDAALGAALDGRPGPRRARAARAPARRGAPLRRGRLRDLPLPHDGRRRSALVADRALLVPTLHDEPPARLAIFHGGVRRRAGPGLLHRGGAGAGARALRRRATTAPASPAWGLDPPPPSDPARMARRSASARPVRALRRAGRPLEGRRRARRAPRALPAGRARTASTWCSWAAATRRCPRHPWLHRLGFVEERRQARRARRRGGRRACRRRTRACRSPSSRRGRHGRPTLANAASPVLVGQSRRSGGGLWYRDGDEYAAMLDLLARAAAPGRRDRPPGAALTAARRAAGTACARSGWTRSRSPPAGAAARDGRRPEHLRARAGALPASPGVALAGLLDHRGRWVASRPSRSGLCVLVALLYPLGALMAGRRRRRSRSAIVAAALASRSALRLRAAGPGRPARATSPRALRPTWAEAAVLGRGAVAGAADPAPDDRRRASRRPSP